MIDGDPLYDLRLNTDRQVEIGADGDLRITNPIETVEQSVMIQAGNAVRDLIGKPLNGGTYTEAEGEITKAIERDTQIDDVVQVTVTKVNKATGSVFVKVFVSYNESFELELIG